MLRGCGRKGLALCRCPGDGWQGRHFHGDRCRHRAEGAGGFEDLRLLQAQPRGPGGGGGQENDATGLHAGEPHLLAEGIRQHPAQLPVELIQRHRARDQRRYRVALRHRSQTGAQGRTGTRTRRLHGRNLTAWGGMNIILVTAARSAPKTLDLRCPRTRLRCAAVLAAGVLALAGSGAALALLLASPSQRALAEVRALRAQVQAQQGQLGGVQRDAQRDVNALAVKLGQLEAQSLRLGALGERLAQAGKLDDGEFNFDVQPGVGGPEIAAGDAAYGTPASLQRSIAALGQRFDQQQAQLAALETLLLDRKMDSALQPAGMPVHDGFIASYFGDRPDPFNGSNEFHTGLDIDAPAGTDIHAVAEGVVTYAGVRSGYGNVVEIDHGNGYATRYAHAEKLLVHVGERVRVGQDIALVGSTGRSTGPHVHFEVWYHGRVINPLAFVRSRR